MAPTILDPDAATTIYLVQKDGHKLVNRVELRILAAALETNSYWTRFLQHMNTTIGFRPSNEHVEDMGISTVAVEIVLRALHHDYHRKLKEFEITGAGGESSINPDGTSTKDKNEDHREDATAARANGNATTMQKGDENMECKTPAELVEEALSKVLSKLETTISSRNTLMTPFAQPGELGYHFPKELSQISVDGFWGVLPLINFETCGVDHKGKLDVDRELLLPWFVR